MQKGSFIYSDKIYQKNNIHKTHPIPDSTGTVPPTYSGYLSTFKYTGRFDGTLLPATMQCVTIGECRLLAGR